MTMWNWRRMQPADMADVVALSERIHPDLPEDAAVQSQRRDVFPAGCWVLERAGGLAGYVFAHPITPNAPPPLNTAPSRIEAAQSQLYLHDLVVAPETRGSGQARVGVEKILTLGQDFDSTALISVYGTQGFWARFGFAPAQLANPAKLASYGEGATFMIRKR